MRQPLDQPFESVVFPESIIYCLRKPRTKFMSLTKNVNDTPEYPIPLIGRTSIGKVCRSLFLTVEMKNLEPEHFFSVCIAPMYGTEPKWLMISEFIEYYKLQVEIPCLWFVRKFRFAKFLNLPLVTCYENKKR